MQDENDSVFSHFQSNQVTSARKSLSKSNLQKSRSAHKVPRLPALVLPNGKVQNVSDEEEGNATVWGATGCEITNPWSQNPRPLSLKMSEEKLID